MTPRPRKRLGGGLFAPKGAPKKCCVLKAEKRKKRKVTKEKKENTT